MALPVCAATALGLLVGCTRYDPRDQVFTGDEAKQRISRGAPLPQSADDFYLFDGGSFNGTIEYWSFRCATIEDCWAAVRNLGGPEKTQFVTWRPSKLAVVMQGPAFYWPELATSQWDVRTMRSGFVCERQDGDRSLEFYAIDLDQSKVYCHKESGGFPTEKHEPVSQPRTTARETPEPSSASRP